MGGFAQAGQDAIAAEQNVLYARSASDTASSVDSIAISPADVEICQHPDGRAWVLGAGNFGKVGFSTY